MRDRAISNQLAKKRARRRGLGLIELLISLAISAALLTATAVAVDASFKAYAVNQEQSGLMQQSRISMNRILSTIRSATAHAPDSATPLAQFATGVTVTDTGIAMFDEHGTNIIFRYDAENRRILAVINGTTRILCRGVTEFTVRMEPMRSPNALKTGGAWDELRRATILISVQTTSQTSQVGESTQDQIITLSASAVPRRNAW